MDHADRRLEAEVTPPHLYFTRRSLLRGGVIAAGALATGGLYRRLNGVTLDASETRQLSGVRPPSGGPGDGFVVDDPRTPRSSVVNYNNFYEFTTSKQDVAKAAAGFDASGWKVVVDGMVGRPRVFDLDDLRRLAPLEERVYRMRCVEAWSMVVPWVGYSLRRLLEAVEPMSSARYVAFESLLDPARLPNQTSTVLPWPYREGLRVDEAMHPLTLLTFGLYGAELPPQDGAPVRLIVPWKYGFKGIKSIVKISLVSDRPRTTWSQVAPREYGFYANVNPEHPHPRWSQATEQRIGESGRRATLRFNGYEAQVASLYAGMDLHVDY